MKKNCLKKSSHQLDNASSSAPEIQFQVVKITASNPPVLAKQYSLINGELAKTSAGKLVRGEYKVVTLKSIGGLAKLIKNLQPSQALTYGIPQTPEKHGAIASRPEAAPGELTRTRGDFDWPKGPAILFLDYDPPKAPPEGFKRLKAKELWGKVVEICPVLAEAPAIIMSSASGFIYSADTGEELKGAGGWHFYILVADGRDIPRAGKLIYDIAWMAGYGRYDISKAGTLLERSLIDAAVWQPERLDFAAGASCSPPLEQRRPGPIVLNLNAGPFDTRILTPVADTKKLAALKTEARAAVTGEAERVRAKWIEVQVAKLMDADNETDPAKRKEKEDRLRLTYRRSTDEMVLQGDFLLTSEDGRKVTVNDLLDNPCKWNGKRFHDPLEPDYHNDNRIATAYLQTGKKPAIYSYAHGEQRYFLARENAGVAVVATVAVAEWSEPFSLVAQKKPEPYPLDKLPGTIGNAIREVVDFVQCPSALAGCSALSVISTVGQGLIDVRRTDHLEGPTSLFVLAIADSGERKSTADGFFSKPIYQWEAAQAQAAKPGMIKHEAEKAAWEAKRSGLMALIKQSTKSGKPTVNLEKKAVELETEKPFAPKIPRLMFGEATQEEVANRLAHGWPVGGVLSSEAGIVFGGHAMNKESAMRNMAMLNSLWGAEPFRIDRKTTQSFTVRGARLTMGLAVQSKTIRDFVDSSNGLSRGIGFLARFLIAWPESTQGCRRFKEPSENWSHLPKFYERLGALLDQPLRFNDLGELDPVVLGLSQKAKAAWVRFHDEIEAKLSAGGDLAEAQDVASKAADNAVRMAALFHLFEVGIKGPIKLGHMNAAIGIVDWHLYEALRFITEIALPQELSDALKLDEWLIRYCSINQVAKVSSRDAQHYGPNRIRKGTAFNQALKELIDAGRARLVKHGLRKVIEINPALLEGGQNAV